MTVMTTTMTMTMNLEAIQQIKNGKKELQHPTQIHQPQIHPIQKHKTVRLHNIAKKKNRNKTVEQIFLIQNKRCINDLMSLAVN